MFCQESSLVRECSIYGQISLARAAEIAEVSLVDMIRQAHAAGVEPRWSETMLSEELT